MTAMKISVIPADNAIVVDGIAHNPVGATYPEGVRAIQWDKDHGFIEHHFGGQEVFDDFGYMAPFVALHATAAAAAAAEAEANKPPEPVIPAPPTFAELKALEVSIFINTREQMCARVAGIGQRLARSGDNAGALSCDAVVNALLDVPAHPTVTGAADIESLKLALKARYAAAVSLASASARTEFKRYDK